MTVPRIVVIIAALLLGACAPMVTRGPLFNVADQVGPPPIEEGIWIAISDDCPERNAQRRRNFPTACAPIEIRRLPDQRWRIAPRPDLLRTPSRYSGQWEDESTWVIVAGFESGASPFYVLQPSPAAADARVSYSMLIPITSTELPARRFVAAPIECTTVLGRGPMAGIAPLWGPRTPRAVPVEGPGPPDEPTRLRALEINDALTEELVLQGCIPITQQAAREGAQRMAIESLPALLADPNIARHIWVAPLDR